MSSKEVIMNEECIICKRNSNLSEGTNSITYECNSCGKYSVLDRVQPALMNESKDTLFKLSCLLAEHKIKNNTKILLTNTHLELKDNLFLMDYVKWIKEFPTNALEILERSLLNIAAQLRHPADRFFIEEDKKELFFSSEVNQLGYVVEQLSKLGYITNIEVLNDWINIETEGWRKIEELKRIPFGGKKQAFIAMWFNESTLEYYNNGIEPAIEDQNIFKALRVDRLEHNNKICDQIIGEIKKSKFVVADFSGERGGVYFEAGYAQGFGIPVIWIVHKDWLNKLHFDTRQYNHIVYENAEELYQKLKARIQATIL